MNGRAPGEGRRRALHLASGAVGLSALVLPHRVTTVLLLSLGGVALGMEVARQRVPVVRALIDHLAGPLFRPAEARGVSGATLLVAGYAATWLIFAPVAAVPAMLVAATADPAAATVGRWARPIGGVKTWAGTAGAFAVGVSVLLVAGVDPVPALAAAGAAALVERLPGRGVDNVAIPLTTAATLAVLA